MSKGEDKIAKLLSQSGIYFKREKTFSDLKHGKFRYDFYIITPYGEQFIVEYNGEQHYHYVSKFFKTPREWRRAQENDRRKISYALANNIKIFIIPFWEIDKINHASEIFQEKYRARNRWKNDEELIHSPLYKKN